MNPARKNPQTPESASTFDRHASINCDQKKQLSSSCNSLSCSFKRFGGPGHKRPSVYEYKLYVHMKPNVGHLGPKCHLFGHLHHQSGLSLHQKYVEQLSCGLFLVAFAYYFTCSLVPGKNKTLNPEPQTLPKVSFPNSPKAWR